MDALSGSPRVESWLHRQGSISSRSSASSRSEEYEDARETLELDVTAGRERTVTASTVDTIVANSPTTSSIADSPTTGSKHVRLSFGGRMRPISPPNSPIGASIRSLTPVLERGDAPSGRPQSFSPRPLLLPKRISQTPSAISTSSSVWAQSRASSDGRSSSPSSPDPQAKRVSVAIQTSVSVATQTEDREVLDREMQDREMQDRQMQDDANSETATIGRRPARAAKRPAPSSPITPSSRRPSLAVAASSDPATEVARASQRLRRSIASEEHPARRLHINEPVSPVAPFQALKAGPPSLPRSHSADPQTAARRPTPPAISKRRSGLIGLLRPSTADSTPATPRPLISGPILRSELSDRFSGRSFVPAGPGAKQSALGPVLLPGERLMQSPGLDALNLQLGSPQLDLAGPPPTVSHRASSRSSSTIGQLSQGRQHSQAAAASPSISSRSSSVPAVPRLPAKVARDERPGGFLTLAQM